MTHQLRVPGPTPVPRRVVEAMGAPMINHRGPEFADLMGECKPGLQQVFKTKNDVLIFTCSGTGGLEAAVQNLTSPGEPALFVSVGAFGDRFAAVGKAYGAEVVKLEYPMGHGAVAGDVAKVLDENPGVEVVFITHNETSTGVCNDLTEIASEVKRRGKLIAVDGVSSVSAIDLPTDELGLDVVVSGSQKGWMLPPGLAFVSVSQAAFEHAATTKAPRFYFDFVQEAGYEAKGQTFSTPAVSLLFGLRESLKIFREEGLEQVFERHREIGRGIRAGVKALELELLADPAFYSDTVTAVLAPGGDPELNAKLTKKLREDYDLVVAGGQGQLQGKIFRIGHLGDISRDDAREIVRRLEAALVDIGYIDAQVGAVDALEAAMAQPAPA